MKKLRIIGLLLVVVILLLCGCMKSTSINITPELDKAKEELKKKIDNIKDEISNSPFELL